MRSLVVAPHPDDELLGVGGTILRKKNEGKETAWMIVTSINEKDGWNPDVVRRRANEISAVAEYFGFSSVFELGFPAAQLDLIPTSELVTAISSAFNVFMPEEIFVPHPSDVHTDHRIVFNAVASCSKWFRHPSVKQVLAYETLSETDFGLKPDEGFRPNYFVNISAYLDQKISATKLYSAEFQEHPFPRSCTSLTSLARLRGAASGFDAAEAFQLLLARS